MSNLGWYQTMTTAAKKVGGPIQLSFLVGILGYGLGKTIEIGGKEILKRISKKSKKVSGTNIYVVQCDGQSNEGLHVKIGDSIKVLEIDNDAVLIEKKGDTDNPYFVSADFLRSISDFDS